MVSKISALECAYLSILVTLQAMSLKQKIEAAIVQSMKNKEAAKLRGLREIKAQLLLLETSGEGAITEEKEMAVLQKMAKQRQDSLEIYEKQGRDDLAQKEIEELNIISQYLPKQLGADEIENLVNQIIAETGADGMKDMGKVMGLAKQKVGAQADGKTLAQIVRNLLSQ